jgi:hypothetical protein
VESIEILTRVYIDNYYVPQRSGEVVFSRRDRVCPEVCHNGNYGRCWQDQRHQTCELSAELFDGRHGYKLILEPDPISDSALPVVKQERLQFNGLPIFEFENGLKPPGEYPLDPHRSALFTMPLRFRVWLNGLVCFRLDPFSMGLLSSAGDVQPDTFSRIQRLRNFAIWYPHVRPDTYADAAFRRSLQDSIEGFDRLVFEKGGEKSLLLYAVFEAEGSPEVRVEFHELSDGQRCLICLYAILHFKIARGGTVILDEPENFISVAGDPALVDRRRGHIGNQWSSSSDLASPRVHQPVGSIQWPSLLP